MSNNYCQCPVCYSVYEAVSEKQAKTLVRQNKRFYKMMQPFHSELFFSDYKPINLYKYCHYCGMESYQFMPATDFHSNPLSFVAPIIFEKNVDTCKKV